MIANNPRLAEVGSQNNQQKAAAAGRAQAAMARIAMDKLLAQRPSAHRDRWIAALLHRISSPNSSLAELGQAMTPPLTKHAYAALLRRALRGGGITAAGPDDREGGST